MTDQIDDGSVLPDDDTTLPPQDDASQPSDDIPPGDDAAALADEANPDDPPDKPKKSAQERINELTRQKRELERQLAVVTAPPAQEPQPVTDGRPDPDEFEAGIYDPAYVEAMTDWKVERAVAENNKKQTVQQTLHTKVQIFEERTSEAFPDGEPDGLAAFRALPTLPQAVQDIVLESEQGPLLADYFGSKPGELQRLSALPPTLQAYEVAKIEARLSKPVAKTTTSAPEPAPTLRGAQGRFKPAPDTQDFAAFEAAYKPG